MYMRKIIFKPLFIFETYTNALSKVVMEKTILQFLALTAVLLCFIISSNRKPSRLLMSPPPKNIQANSVRQW